MAPVKIDFTGVSGGGNFEPLPEGNYPAVITKASSGISQAGNPKLEFEFTLENGRKQWRHFALTPNAMWALKEFLEQMEFELPEGEFEFDPEELVGERVVLELGTRPHWQDPDKLDNEVLSVARTPF